LGWKPASSCAASRAVGCERLPDRKRPPVPLTAMSASFCFSSCAEQKRTTDRIETLLPCRKRKKAKILPTNSACEIPRALLAEYQDLLEKVRAAQLERAEGLRSSMDSVVIKPLLQELKVECNAARARYLDHRRGHGC
jgi:hypothetical protein